MATTRSDETCKITLQVNTGTQADPVYKNRIFNHINPLLSDSDALDVGTSLASLQTHALSKVTRTDTATLSEE